MKKVFSLTLAVLCIITMIGTFTACSDDAAGIVGKWAYESSDDMYYTFNEDGTGAYSFMGSEMKFTYTDDGAEVTIQYENSTAPNVFKYTIEDKTLKIEDSFGSITNYIKK